MESETVENWKTAGCAVATAQLALAVAEDVASLAGIGLAIKAGRAAESGVVILVLKHALSVPEKGTMKGISRMLGAWVGSGTMTVWNSYASSSVSDEEPSLVGMGKDFLEGLLPGVNAGFAIYREVEACAGQTTHFHR